MDLTNDISKEHDNKNDGKEHTGDGCVRALTVNVNATSFKFND